MTIREDKNKVLVNIPALDNLSIILDFNNFEDGSLQIEYDNLMTEFSEEVIKKAVVEFLDGLQSNERKDTN